MKIRSMMIALAVLPLVLAASNKAEAAQAGYYKQSPLFHFHPDENKSKNHIGRMGPTGLHLELLKPAFTMRITDVEEGSPAAATGQLKQGQYIESINGTVLKDIDPRIILGNLITEAEAKDGKLKLMVKDKPDTKATPVTIQLPVLGAYSETWPVDCKKSDTIVRNMADYLAQSDRRGWGAALFLLSTGEEKDLDVVRGWFSGKLSADSPGFPWSIGYTGPAICEYYLRTGDESVLPAIKSRADYLRDTIYNGSWMGRGNANFNYMAGGHMNAAGVHCVNFLLMAKECGVDVDEQTLQTSLKQFYKYAGHGNVPYGDQFPEGGFTDNGRVGGLAFAMQAAANLMPDGENSSYAKASDISATKAFYSTSWLFHGHTGGGIGELWRGSSMGLMKDKRPQQYRSFMNERRWMYELARTPEGAFGWPAGMNVNYTGVNTGKPNGNYIPLIYTLPRKQLRMFGAPPTKYSKTYKLPDRPWGTPADDAFFSLEAGKTADGQQLDVSEETIRNGASRAIFARIKSPDVSQETLHKYALHIDQGIRASTMGQIKQHGWDHLTLKLLQSDDPRGRHSGIMGVGGLPKPLSDDVITLLTDMINDPDESWWVVQEALKDLAHASADQLAPHVPRLETWLAHEDWWLKAAALQAMTPLMKDAQVARRLIPQIAAVMADNQRPGMNGPFNSIGDSIRQADAKVQAMAARQFANAYGQYPERISAPGAQDMSAGTEYMIRHIAAVVAKTPGGFDELYEISKARYPNASLPHKELYLQADPDRLGPKLQESMKDLILEELIPEFIGKGHHPQSNRGYLLNEATSAEPLQWGFYYRRPRMAELVRLYQQAGIHAYDWHDFGPEWTDMQWHYLTFDPPEKKMPGTGTRYREVTLPEGTENWYKPGFDPEHAGWKTGRQPIGQRNGKLVTKGRKCRFDFCRCGEPMQTLWENEVLLMRNTFKFPKLKEGCRYRLLVGGMSHVNAGDGFRIYVDGKLMMERERGVGKREGAQPLAYYIDKAWWPAFNSGETTIAATSFLKVGQNSQHRHFSIWLQEMKVPPMDADVIRTSATKVPMTSAEWQSLQDPDRNVGPNDGKFVWDGEFVPNPDVLGSWTQLGRVASIDAFDPGAGLKRDTRSPLQQITFKDQGHTNDRLWIWSGSKLLNLRKNEALGMTQKTIKGMKYLFIETGGFNPKHGPDWKPSLYVLKRTVEKAGK